MAPPARRARGHSPAGRRGAGQRAQDDQQVVEPNVGYANTDLHGLGVSWIRSWPLGWPRTTTVRPAAARVSLLAASSAQALMM